MNESETRTFMGNIMWESAPILNQIKYKEKAIHASRIFWTDSNLEDDIKEPEGVCILAEKKRDSYFRLTHSTSKPSRCYFCPYFKFATKDSLGSLYTCILKERYILDPSTKNIKHALYLLLDFNLIEHLLFL